MIPPRRDFFIPPRQEICLVFIWTKYNAGMKSFKRLTSYFCCNKFIKIILHMLKREKFIPPSRDEMFVWEFFIPARWDEVCLYGNFSSRLGGILSSVAEILSRRDKWQDHINAL